MVDFNDATAWELVYQQVLFSAWDARYRALHVAPQQIEIVNSSGVLVEVLHQPERPTWRRAGRVRQLVAGFDGELIRAPGSQRLYLGTRHHFSFELGSATAWQLEIEFVEWLQRVQLSVWQYTKAIENPILESLELLREDVLRLEGKIDRNFGNGSLTTGFNNPRQIIFVAII